MDGAHDGDRDWDKRQFGAADLASSRPATPPHSPAQAFEGPEARREPARCRRLLSSTDTARSKQQVARWAWSPGSQIDLTTAGRKSRAQIESTNCMSFCHAGQATAECRLLIRLFLIHLLLPWGRLCIRPREPAGAGQSSNRSYRLREKRFQIRFANDCAVGKRSSRASRSTRI